MSDQDDIVPLFIEKEDMEASSSSAALPPLLPFPKQSPQGPLSPFLTQVDKYIERLTGKKLVDAIDRVSAANPKVYQFKKGDRVPSVIKAHNDGVTGKKLRNKWMDLRFAFGLVATLKNGVSVFGYASSGKDDSLAGLPVTDPSRFVMIPSPNLAMFHAPDFDPAEYYTATQQDQRTVPLRTQDGTTFWSVNFDPRLVIRHAKLAEAAKSKKSATTPTNRNDGAAMDTQAKKKKKKGNTAGDGGDLGLEACLASFAHLLSLQRATSLSDVPVVLGQSTHYKTLEALLGPERFPLMRSEDADGLHMLPHDIGGDLRASVECFLKLVFVEKAPTTGRWDTDAIMRALLILQMAPQFITLPGVSFLRSRGMALSEKNIADVMADFENSDDSHAMIARAVAQLTTAKLIFEDLVTVDHPVLKTAIPLLAFATCALRLGELRVEQFHPGAVPNPPVLRCALTGMAIVPGMSFYMLRAKSRPTAALPMGQAMIAIVAKSVDDPFMCLYRVHSLSLSLSLSHVRSFSHCFMQTVTTTTTTEAPPKAKKATSAVTKKTPEQIQAAREKKNEQAREKRRLKKEEEEAAAARGPSSSPPPTPVPSPRKVKKRAPDESANTKATKKSRVDSVDGTPYLGTSPVLEAADYVLDASPTFQAFASFATIDPVVNQASAVFLAKAPTRYDPAVTPEAAFKTWVTTNQAVFLQLSPVFQAFVKKRTALSIEQQQCLADATDGDSAAQGGGDDENSDDMVLDDVDDETRAAMAEMGLAVPEKKKARPPPAFPVKPAPVQGDALFAPFVTMVAKLPLKPSKFITALEERFMTPLTLHYLLAIVKEASGVTDETTLKKTLGNTLAAFKWLFPSAAK
jgi:hypothetical protein